MNKNGDLQDRIGIQMGQVKMVEIKEAAEEREKWEDRGRGEEKEHKSQTHGYPQLGQ
jgi:hypothetical protein